jgi:hypothetical protein
LTTHLQPASTFQTRVVFLPQRPLQIHKNNITKNA